VRGGAAPEAVAEQNLPTAGGSAERDEVGIPSVGCADTLLCGEHAPPGPNRGDWAPVTDGGELVGACLRTRQRSRPVFVSPGYGLDVELAVRIVLHSTVGYRLPEPLRRARVLARRA